MQQLAVIAVASILIISSVIGFLLIQKPGSHTPTVLQPARLVVSPSTLDFGKLEQGVKAALTVEISNIGEQQLSWTADTGSAPWLTVQTRTATIEPGGSQQSNNVMVDTGQLPPGGRSAQLFIRSNSGNASVTVKLEVIPPGPKKQPKLSLSTSSFNLGTLAAETQMTLTMIVSNVGAQTLNWKADTGNTGWLSADKNSGTIQSGGQPETINMTVNTTGLSAGPYQATLNITSNGGNQKVPISLVLNPLPSSEPPILKVNPSSLDFGQMGVNATATKQVTLSNSGGKSLTWNADTGGSPWLKLNGSTGGAIPPGSQQIISVTVNTTGLTSGSQQATLNITSNGGNQKVPISLMVTSGPILKMSPPSLDFGQMGVNATATKQVTLSNSGGKSLTWNADTGGTTWLRLSMSTGTIQPGTQQTINVAVDTTGLSAGSQSAALNITSNGGNRSIPVAVTVVPPPPQLCKYSPLDFGQVQQGQTKTLPMTFSNCGGQQLTWSATNGNTAWLSLDGNPTSNGTLNPNQQGTIQVLVDTSQLQPGSYPAAITFTTNEPNGGNESVTVSVTVTPPPPCLNVAPSSLSFTAQAAGTPTPSQPVTVSNCGSQSLTWAAQTDGSSWLSIDNTGGTINSGGQAQTINVSVNAASLSAGSYTATVTVSANGAQPVQVTITLTVQ